MKNRTVQSIYSHFRYNKISNPTTVPKSKKKAWDSQLFVTSAWCNLYNYYLLSLSIWYGVCHLFDQFNLRWKIHFDSRSLHCCVIFIANEKPPTGLITKLKYCVSIITFTMEGWAAVSSVERGVTCFSIYFHISFALFNQKHNNASFVWLKFDSVFEEFSNQ